MCYGSNYINIEKYNEIVAKIEARKRARIESENKSEKEGEKWEITK